MREVRQEAWHYPAANGEGDVFARVWLPSGQPQAVVQIAHGMSEHSGRYDGFARFLSGQGLVVVANDHAGHGQSAQGHLGSFSAKAGGFDDSVKDLHRLFELAEKNCGTLPRILFGQSMGSLMAALYAERYGKDLTALVMSATPSAINFSKVFQLLAAGIAATRGQLARSPLLERLTGSVQGMTEEEKTQARSWLTRDVEKIREFNNDPLCGFDYSAGGYHTMLKAYHHVNAKTWGRQMPDIPILITAGADDPSSGKGAGPARFVEQLTRTGHARVELKLFEDARHELVNELNREEIYACLCSWFLRQLPPQETERTEQQ